MSQPAIIAKRPAARRRRALPFVKCNDLIVAVSLTTAVVVLAVAAPWPFPAALALAAAGLGVAVARRRGLLLVGPLFFYDLIRLARRGRSTLLRCVYALVLFGGLWFTYSNRFPHIDVIGRAFDQGPTLPARKVNEFALEFVVAILVVQGAAALVLTPAYLAGAVAEEKERKSLALLFTTDLRDREIVLGKLFGRLTHLAGVLFTGLPILSLTQLLGGVDIRVVVSGFIVTGMTLLSAGGVSILCSVLCRRVLSAVLLSYGFVILFSSGCLCTPVHAASSPMAFMLELSRRLNLDHETELLGSPFSLMTTVGSTATPPDATLTMTEMVLAFVVVHGTIACICLAMAVARVRPKYLLPFGLPPRVPRRAAIPRVETVGGWDPADIPAALPARPTAARRNALDLSHALPPQIGDEALLWKEMHHGATVAPVLVSMTALLVGLVLVAVVFIAALVVLADVTDDRPLGRGIAAAVNPVIRVLSIVLAGMWCFGLAFRAVSAVSRERDQRTLDSLLILPVERSDILRAKWLGSILRLRGLGLCLLAVWGVGLITGALHPLGLVLLASACAIHVAFLASLGIWVSLVSRNTLTAYFAMAMMILVIFVGSWSAQNYSQSLLGIRPDEYDPLVQFLEIGLNPPRSWWFLGLSWHEMAEGMSQNDERLATAVPTVLAGLLVYLSAAWILWLASCWRFQREDSVGSR